MNKRKECDAKLIQKTTEAEADISADINAETVPITTISLLHLRSSFNLRE